MSSQKIAIQTIYNIYKNDDKNKVVSSRFFIERIQKMKEFYFSFPEIFKNRFYFESDKQKIDERVYKELDESISLKFIEIHSGQNKQVLLLEWLDKPCALFIFNDLENEYYITDEYRFSKICDFINLIDSQYTKEVEVNTGWKEHITNIKNEVLL